METLQTLLTNPLVLLALLLAVVVVFTRFVIPQRHRDGLIIAELALALCLVLFAGWQAVRTAQTERTQTTRIQALEATVREQTERATQAETAAAQAQKEKDIVKGRIAWREISEEQARDFSTLLWTSPKGKVNVSYVIGDAETTKYAQEICKMLRRAGYDAPEDLKGMIPISPMGPPIVGVKISARRQENAVAGGLQQGLRRIGVDIRGRVDPAQEEDVLIIVGRKSL